MHGAGACLRYTLRIVCAALAAGWGGTSFAQTAIQLDRSWGRTPANLAPSASAATVAGNRGITHAVPGNVYTIAEAQGRTAGANLFHSFQTFSIATGDAAVFTTSTPSLQNVISRVSGASPTQINGLLALTAKNGGAPNFFFINPAGVSFGAGAQVDVPAALHVSTASRLHMGDQVFRAGAGPDSSLIVAAPEAFGFLGSEGAASFRSVKPDNGPPAVMASRLDVTAPRVDLAASKLTVLDGGIRMLATGTAPAQVGLEGMPVSNRFGTLSMDATLEAIGPRYYSQLSGRLQAGAVAMSGGGPDDALSPLEVHGSLIRSDGLLMKVQGLYAVPDTAPAPAPPRIFIAGDQVEIANTQMFVDPGGRFTGPSPGIDIDAKSLVLTGSNLQSAAGYNGTAGGDIRIDVEADAHMRATSIATLTFSPNNAGSVDIRARNLSMHSSSVYSEAEQLAQGDSGGVHIDMDDRFALQSGSTVYTATRSPTGGAGPIDISAARIEVGRLGISQTAAPLSSGLLGGVALHATDTMSIEYPGVRIVNSAVVADPSQVLRAVLSLDAPLLKVSDDARIAAHTHGNLVPAEVLLNGVRQVAPPPPASVATSIVLAGAPPVQLSPSDSGNVVHTASGSTRFVAGNIYAIEEGFGVLAEDNLWHSFEHFDLGLNDAAVFRTDTPGVRHVIARITGSAPTHLQGLLAMGASAGPHPNLFFINPAGIVVSAGAWIDAPARVYFSTAARLRLADGSFVTAGAGSGSAQLSSVAPVAIEFTGDEGDITFAGVLASRNDPWIASALDVSSSAIDVRDSVLVVGSSSQPSASRGAPIRLVAVGETPYSLPLDGAPQIDPRGMVTLSNSIVESVGPRFVGTLNARNPFFPFDDLFPRLLRASWIGVASDETSGGGKLIDVRGPVIRSLGASMVADALDDPSGWLSGSPVSLSIQGGAVDLFDSLINANSFRSSGPGVDIAIAADTLSVDGSGSIAIAHATGPGGAMQLDVTGRLGGIRSSARNFIGTQTRSAARAGDLTVHARDIELHGVTISSGTDVGASGLGGAVRVSVSHDIELNDRADISTYNHGTGRTGDVEVRAQNILLRSASFLFSGDTHIFAALGRSADAGPLGGISIEADTLALGEQSAITTRAWSFGAQSGDIVIAAANDLIVDNRSTIDTNAGGNWLLDANGAVLNYDNSAGAVEIHARRILVNDLGRIAADALPGSSGMSGGITVVAGERLTLSNWGHISLANFAVAGNPDAIDNNITLVTPWIQLLDVGFVLSETFGNAPAADILVRPSPHGAGRLAITSNIPSELTSSTTANGAFGLESFFAGREHLIASGTGGDLDIRATDFTLSRAILNSDSKPGATGNAGSVTIAVTGTAVVEDGARISTNAFDRGNAGDVTITAHELVLDASEIASTVDERAQDIVVEGFNFRHFYPARTVTGDGGNVRLNLSGDLRVLNGGVISASTISRSGNAGSVSVDANEVLVDGASSAIRAEAVSGSSGQTGNLSVAARGSLTLANGASLSIENDAAVDRPQDLLPTVLFVAAPSVILKESEITAESSGNVAASDIRIRFGDRLIVDPSSVTTSANTGDGGDIDIAGSGLLWLDRSRVTTSGGTGNGGDIRIQAHTLVMETGFIQANTGGVGATGGNVSISVQALVPSAGRVAIGGAVPVAFDPNAFGLNVIQAAAPTGVSGLIGISAPVLDIAGELSGLEAEVVDVGPMGRDLCRMGAGSSLTPLGRGGLRPSAAGLMRPENVPATATAAADLASTRAALPAIAFAYDCK